MCLPNPALSEIRHLNGQIRHQIHEITHRASSTLQDPGECTIHTIAHNTLKCIVFTSKRTKLCLVERLHL